MKLKHLLLVTQIDFSMDFFLLNAQQPRFFIQALS